ncbi:c-type cytochrome [Paludibacterium paludis]|uniref:Cytochrome c n=1 Tax=Paludibacterium paludis TaxID=1225769 RepID=A0A918P3X4_9NEIS|nr:cytochrome c [Paludibacterium paludis]GGY17519.1 cytochrome c [Paludibacterium paludis]
MTSLKTLGLLALSLLAGSALAGVDTGSISRGAYLARVSDCIACHSAPGGKPNAGGLPMDTPVGKVYSTNITPDKETGIGNYTYDEFARALREGVAREGHSLYPAMPYTSFARINDADMKDLYAYFMGGVEPVRQSNRASDIPWPLSMRWPLTVWRWLFHDASPYQPVASRGAQWNRGAYLVQGMAHCGTCHTPRGFAFQEVALSERQPGYLTGARLAGWFAGNLTADPREGLGNWSPGDLTDYLREGRNRYTAAFGPMAEVVHYSSQYIEDADLKAIAAYIKSLPSSGAARVESVKTGAALYAENCATCHQAAGQGHERVVPSLAGSSAVMARDPSSLIRVVLEGGVNARTRHLAWEYSMPGYAHQLSDRDVAEVLSYLRQSWGNAAGAVSAQEVGEIRSSLPAIRH